MSVLKFVFPGLHPSNNRYGNYYSRVIMIPKKQGEEQCFRDHKTAQKQRISSNCTALTPQLLLSSSAGR